MMPKSNGVESPPSRPEGAGEKGRAGTPLFRSFFAGGSGLGAAAAVGGGVLARDTGAGAGALSGKLTGSLTGTEVGGLAFVHF